jgi:gamma-glutamyl-gamma-aminobutyrate hydrolase PuuD
LAHPVIGITTSRVPTGDRPHDRLGLAYIEAVYAAGGLPVMIPNQSGPDILDRLDGLIISGGGDFDPATFGAEDQGTYLPGVNPDRDRTELELLRSAPRDLPILGICRGIQALSVAFGGTLIQDIPSRVETPIRHSQEGERGDPTHAVDVRPDSKLGMILGAQEILVNSFHHQAVDRVPDGFRAVAWAPDGIVEGMESVDRPFCVGVQWHPEDLVGEQDHARRLFAALVRQSREYRRD